MQKAVYLKISGEVQGVNLRYNVMEKARQDGLNGWICNEADGTVACCLVNASGAKVNHFVGWLKNKYHITNIEQEDGETEARYDNFIIKY